MILERNKSLLEAIVKKSNELYIDDSLENKRALEQMLDEYVIFKPKAVNLLIKLALLVYSVPIYDIEKTKYTLHRILEIEPHNIESLLFLTYVEYNSYGISQELYNKLNNVHNENKLILSMLAYAKALFFYQLDDDKNFEHFLHESIFYDQGFVWNYYRLAQFYNIKHQYKKSCINYQKALHNVRHIYKSNEPYDILSIEEFLNENIKGIHLSKANYEIIEDEVLQVCPKQ